MLKSVKSQQSNKKEKVKVIKKTSKLTRKTVALVNMKSSEKKKMKRINYSHEDVEKALNAMRDTGLSLRKAASAYGVPVATLSRKKNNPATIKKKTGPETVLSLKEELSASEVSTKKYQFNI